MFVKSFISVAGLAAVTALGTTSAHGQITIPTISIGNPSNAADPTTGYGSMAYTYNIGTTEVTNAQYTAFLNAVADSDNHGLYNNAMSSPLSGISRSGLPGFYNYSVDPGRANHPVNYVSFWDTARFSNWLHNGQPTGSQNASTTEDGAYTLTSGGITANTVTRNAGALWAVTSEDEWYKAAYHQPASQGGDSDNYWLYPTSSNTITTAQANYFNLTGSTAPVGSYAANFYGTFDMGGNVFEWNEAIILGALRGVRGGSAANDGSGLRADVRYSNFGIASDEADNIGFRVSQVPGPSSVALLGLGGLIATRRRRSPPVVTSTTSAPPATAGRAV